MSPYCINWQFALKSSYDDSKQIDAHACPTSVKVKTNVYQKYQN